MNFKEKLNKKLLENLKAVREVYAKEWTITERPQGDGLVHVKAVGILPDNNRVEFEFVMKRDFLE